MVSLENYKCFCLVSSGLELFKSRKGDQFIKCKKSGCGFFTSAINMNEYLHVIEEKLLEDYKLLDIVICDHLMPATLSVSKSEKNPGRPYFRCGEKESCDFFQWGDTSPSYATLVNIGKRKEKRSLATLVDKATMTDPVEPQPQKLKRNRQATSKDGGKKKKIIHEELTE